MKKSKPKLVSPAAKPDATVSGLKKAAQRCEKRLFNPVAVCPISHDIALAGELPEQVATCEANLYLIWVQCRKGPAKIAWTPMYVGQRSQKDCRSRLKQHMFKTPEGTQSKLRHVQYLLELGYEFGITTALVAPDSARLSVEDEIIRNRTPTGLLLPWNMKGRSSKREKAMLDDDPEAWRPDALRR